MSEKLITEKNIENVENAGIKSKIKFNYRTVTPTAALLVTIFIDYIIPNNPDAKYRDLTTFRDFLIILAAASVIAFIIGLFNSRVRERYSRQSWFMIGCLILANIINLLTVKFIVLPQLYFPSFNRILQVYVDERAFLLKCIINSFVLMLEGIIIGSVLGIVTGILVGWSKKWNYWIYPIIRILGPIPSSNWLPLALIVFGVARHAAIFIIAFAVWFQMSILTSSGIQGVQKSYFEVSSTLGATNRQNLFFVALPASLSSIFLGFFNATTSSFVALMTAEMMGVKSGIGWYVNWQKEMVSYPNVYAGLILVAFFCYVIITAQFKVRDRLLSWQRGVIKW